MKAVDVHSKCFQVLVVVHLEDEHKDLHENMTERVIRLLFVWYCQNIASREISLY